VKQPCSKSMHNSKSILEKINKEALKIQLR